MASVKGDEEQLAIAIVSKLDNLEKQMAKASGITAKAYREMSLGSKRATKQMEDDAIRSSIRIRQAQAAVGNSIGALGRSFAGMAGTVATVFSAQRVMEASQAYIRASNSLKVAGKSGDDLTKTFEQLYKIAQDNSTPIETLTGLYSKAAQAQSSLKASDQQLIAFTTATAQALRVQGKSAEESSGALLQLGQAISGSKLQAEEYNSLIDGAYPLLQAAAAGLKEAGGEVSKLTALVKDGKVSSAAFFNAIIAGAPVLEDKLAGTTKTISQAWTQFTNVMIRAVGKVDEATGFTKEIVDEFGSFTKAIEANADAMAQWAKDIIGPIKDVVEFLQQANAAGLAVNRWIRESVGLTPPPSAQTSTASLKGDRQRTSQQQIDDAFALFPSGSQKKIKPVSLEDYPLTGDDSKKAKLGEFDREIRSIWERTAALQAEIPVVGMSTAEQAKAEAVQRLKTAAEREGLALTSERLAQIDKVASAYAAETAALEKVKTAQQEHQELLRFAGQEISSFFSDVISGGENAGKALMNLTKRLTDALLQASLLGDGPLAGLLGLKGANGGVGGLLGSLFTGFSSPGTPLNIIPSASGNIFASPGLHSYANTVVDRPTVFPFARGAGLMGEAGPEAIMPLQRDASGRLGVAAGGPASAPATREGDVSIQINNTSGADVRPSVSRGPDGRRLIEIEVAKALASGKADKAMRGRYGAKPTLVRR